MSDPSPFKLPTRVLMLGSGELGKEVVISLQRLGCHVTAVDSYVGAPAMQVADDYRVIDMADGPALAALLESIDVDLVVPEIEAIATDELLRFEERGGARVVPNAFAVKSTMDRQAIRALAAGLDGVATSKFRFASSAEELRDALEHTGLPAFIKPTMSSSGHGQSRICTVDEADEAWRVASEGARSHTGRVIVEEEIRFDCEITLLTIRSWDEDRATAVTSFCAPIGHRQVHGDYVESWQPAAISPRALERCQHMALLVTDALADGGASPALGIFGVEFFIRGDDAWFSELSPRPHDTGMVTMATQHQSEFELHARAILGLPIDPAIASPGASAVIKSTGVCDDPRYEGVGSALRVADDVRIFGKPVTRAGRRLGVVLARGADAETARGRASAGAACVTIRDGQSDCG